MFYAQFYQRAVWPAGTDKITEACGDRAVVILDGREHRTTHHAIARVECHKRGYAGYRLYRGELRQGDQPLCDYTPYPY